MQKAVSRQMEKNLQKMSVKERNIPVFLAPCSPEAAKYESTGDAVKHGAKHIYQTTNEMAYAKVLVGCALGYEQAELEEFITEDINGEFVY